MHNEFSLRKFDYDLNKPPPPAHAERQKISLGGKKGDDQK